MRHPEQLAEVGVQGAGVGGNEARFPGAEDPSLEVATNSQELEPWTAFLLPRLPYPGLTFSFFIVLLTSDLRRICSLLFRFNKATFFD